MKEKVTSSRHNQREKRVEGPRLTSMQLSTALRSSMDGCTTFEAIGLRRSKQKKMMNDAKHKVEKRLKKLKKS
jgi:hypothetical protein